jgi:hypothetical protein
VSTIIARSSCLKRSHPMLNLHVPACVAAVFTFPIYVDATSSLNDAVSRSCSLSCRGHWKRGPSMGSSSLSIGKVVYLNGPP